MNQQKHLRFLISETELHDYKMKAKTIKLKKCFSYFSFNVIKTTSYKLQSLTRLSYTLWGSN